MSNFDFCKTAFDPVTYLFIVDLDLDQVVVIHFPIAFYYRNRNNRNSVIKITYPSCNRQCSLKFPTILSSTDPYLGLIKSSDKVAGNFIN